MKQIVTCLFLTLSLTAFSQQLTYKSGGTVYNAENKRLSSDEVRQLLANNSEALSLYNAGRSKKTWGNVLFYGGIGLVATNLIIGMNTDNSTTSYPGNGYYPSVKSERTNMTVAIIGGALIVASIPIKIGYPKKIKSALAKYNEGLVENYSPAPKATLLASTNQIGLRIEF
ncbi:hypothetical protein OIU80_01200 [Flavobacterium sp. LS1R47]|jgi:hypothetical protein|uniref:Uncharacterized protein n=1 Tax=Flavobacterium frigoritolerans TaxID=2987686 RepID=A0A9X2ZLK9_9FLAO|nr:hypothetical protein [Flavobacterium frigoritolerans]MCV9930887.1 hypothetical protein [Flavobacterium frigoritolerans]